MDQYQCYFMLSYCQRCSEGEWFISRCCCSYSVLPWHSRCPQRWHWWRLLHGRLWHVR